MTDQEKKTLSLIAKQIREFNDYCAEAEYTDTGDVWALLHNIETQLLKLLGEKNDSEK